MLISKLRAKIWLVARSGERSYTLRYADRSGIDLKSEARFLNASDFD